MEQISNLCLQTFSFPLTPISDQLIHFYQVNKGIILNWVKSLKKEQGLLLQSNDQKMKQIRILGQVIVTFMSKKILPNDKDYFQAIQTLDCLLSKYPEIILQVSFSDLFCANIRKFFIKICEEFELEVEEEGRIRIIQFQFYSVLYVIVMLISQAAKSQNGQIKKIPFNIINRTFIVNLLALEIPNNVKIRKLIGFIFLFIVKKVNGKYFGKRIMSFIVKDFQKVQHKKTIHTYISCLSEINQYISFDALDIQKYGLLNQFKIILKYYPHFELNTCILIMIQKIIRKHQSLCSGFFDEETILLIGSPKIGFETHPVYIQKVIQLLNLSLDHCDKSYYKKVFKLNYPLWKSSQFSIRVIGVLADVLVQQQLIQLMKGGYLNELEQIINSNQNLFQEQGMNILQKTLSILARNNWNFAYNAYLKMKPSLYSFPFYKQMRQRVNRLNYIYEKGLFAELKQFSIC